MSSDRQNAANRNNAQRSTGPRSKKGRDVSRHNARRHGLAVAVGADPAFCGDIEMLAKALSRSSDIQKVDAGFRRAAEAELDLMRIRKIRAQMFEQLYFVAGTAAPDRLEELNGELVKLERYERRALSRRKRALREMH